MHTIHPCLSSTGEPRTRHSTWDVVSIKFNQGKNHLPEPDGKIPTHTAQDTTGCLCHKGTACSRVCGYSASGTGLGTSLCQTARDSCQPIIPVCPGPSVWQHNPLLYQTPSNWVICTLKKPSRSHILCSTQPCGSVFSWHRHCEANSTNLSSELERLFLKVNNVDIFPFLHRISVVTGHFEATSALNKSGTCLSDAQLHTVDPSATLQDHLSFT